MNTKELIKVYPNDSTLGAEIRKSICPYTSAEDVLEFLSKYSNDQELGQRIRTHIHLSETNNVIENILNIVTNGR